MTILIVLIGAIGLGIAVAGLPLLRPVPLRDRVLPYTGSARSPRRSSRLLPTRARSDPTEGLRVRLEAAGVGSADGYRIEQVVWAAGAAGVMGVGLVSGVLAGRDIQALPAVAALGLSATIGYLARDWWLGRQRDAIRARVTRHLPTAIDLLTLSIMAGETVPVAFARIARLIEGPTGHQFQLVVDAMRAGMPTVEALEGMALRLDDRSVQRFVDALSDGIERGSPLADVLLSQAEDAREARRQQLLEMGGRREVLMLVPVVFLIMPVVVIFTLYPGLVALDLFVTR